MLISEKVETKWNSKTKKYYMELGYIYTKMKDNFIVNVFDLKDNSGVYVDVKCDYCEKEYKILWSHRTKMIKENPEHKDCCLTCTPKKASETMKNKYGITNAMYSDKFKENLKQTIINKYDCENVFQNEIIKEKIKQDNLVKYGVESYTQTQECKDKKEKTCLIRYGETNHMKTKKYKIMFSKENSPLWKGGFRSKRNERITLEYKEWRTSVFKRDSFVCLKCNKNSRELQAHHILSWKENEDLRYDIDNGITLCTECHKKFHKKYGKTTANRDDILEFIKT